MSKGDKPKYIARAGTAEDNDYMQTIGAAWEYENTEKSSRGLVVRLTATPFNWDGGFILVEQSEDQIDA